MAAGWAKKALLPIGITALGGLFVFLAFRTGKKKGVVQGLSECSCAVGNPDQSDEGQVSPEEAKAIEALRQIPDFKG